MNYLIIDAGNTRVKVAVFASGERIHLETSSQLTLELLESLVKKFNPGSAILSAVTEIDDNVRKYLRAMPKSIELNHFTSLPFKNKYATPTSLGHDRLANAAGAYSMFPGKKVLIIDAGTCLKFDFIDADAAYLGGSISPGLYMRYKAVHQFTEKLPLIEPVMQAELIGNTTISSLHSGILNGMIAEITGIISQYNKEPGLDHLILTGGDARYFLNHLKKPIFASPELTLKGLQSILQYNYPDDIK